MPGYDITFARIARKELERLSQALRLRVFRRIETLADTPRPAGRAAAAQRRRQLGKKSLADGRQQTPGGWNRLHLEVDDIATEAARLRNAGVPFRTIDIVTGPGGAQAILDDPSGNPGELFQLRR